MAIIRIDHTPSTTKVMQALNIIVPEPGRMEGTPVRERKVLYLLHGLSDDATAWQRYTSIETVALEYGLVVVMPSVGRSFYNDLPNGQKYFQYVAHELPQYLEDVFGLKPKRENTFLAGISMGGYGAFKLAFAQPERFAAVASLSGVVSLKFIEMYPNDPRFFEFAFMFGDLNKLSGGPHDPAVWYRKGAEDPSRLPRLFMYCGRQDDLYPANVLVHNMFQQLGIPVDYYEEDARHDWFFWDAQFRRFLTAVLGPMPMRVDEDDEEEA